MKRKCFICEKEIRECMGFVLARDIIFSRGTIRELCEKCSWREAKYNQSCEKQYDALKEAVRKSDPFAV